MDDFPEFSERGLRHHPGARMPQPRENRRNSPHPQNLKSS